VIHPAVKSEIERELERLPPHLQRRVLEFARALVLSQPKGMSGDYLLKFAGILSDEDADAMLKAIDEGCEQVDPDGW
jgi:hypothetical protein